MPKPRRFCSFPGDYCEETAGLFDVSIAPVAELWNFRKAQVPKPAEIAHALEIAKTGHPRIMEDHAQLPIAESKVSLGASQKDTSPIALANSWKIAASMMLSSTLEEISW